MTTSSSLPPGHQSLIPYLMVQHAPRFLEFLKTVFQAEETVNMQREDGTTLHAEVLINGSTLMFCEANDQWTEQNAGLFVYVSDADATYQTALENGASSIQEPSDQEYGRSAGVLDSFGNTWWITSYPKQ